VIGGHVHRVQLVVGGRAAERGQELQVLLVDGSGAQAHAARQKPSSDAH
jgi:hypothetical protein